MHNSTRVFRYFVFSVLHFDNKASLVVQDINEWPIIDPLPSYGRGRDKIGGRFASLIGGSNLTDVVITGEWSEMFSVQTE